MSLNPILLEMMAKDRQRELLAMARPTRVPVPLGHRQLPHGNPVWVQVRLSLARLLIHIGMRLKPGEGVFACPLCPGMRSLSALGPVGPSNCPNRGDAPACPPLHSG